MQKSGDTSSQLIADSAERYGLLVSEVLQPPIDNPEVIIRNNLGKFLFCDGSKFHTELHDCVVRTWSKSDSILWCYLDCL